MTEKTREFRLAYVEKDRDGVERNKKLVRQIVRGLLYLETQQDTVGQRSRTRSGRETWGG